MTTLYVDPDRKAGSQSEQPSAWLDKEFLCFGGYQRFCLAPGTIRIAKTDHKRKYSMFRPYLLANAERGESIMDLGCSAGVMGFQTYLDGYRDIVFVDHDAEYIELVKSGLKHIGASTPRVQVSKVHELQTSADVLFAFAIIHWLYSCTEEFGSLDNIIEKLATHATRTMFIEWVGPDCREVQKFGHLDRNEQVHRDQYNRENFVRALEKRYSTVKLIGRVRQGREIWIATNDYRSPGLFSLWRNRLSFWAWSLTAKIARLPARLRRRRQGSS